MQHAVVVLLAHPLVEGFLEARSGGLPVALGVDGQVGVMARHRRAVFDDAADGGLVRHAVQAKCDLRPACKCGLCRVLSIFLRRWYSSKICFFCGSVSECIVPGRLR